MAYDPSCLELAENFLSDTHMKGSSLHADRLAKDIQDAVESYIGANEDSCPKCGSKAWAYRGDIQSCADCGLGEGR
jgi:hypothetical protein